MFYSSKSLTEYLSLFQQTGLAMSVNNNNSQKPKSSQKRLLVTAAAPKRVMTPYRAYESLAGDEWGVPRSRETVQVRGLFNLGIRPDVATGSSRRRRASEEKRNRTLRVVEEARQRAAAEDWRHSCVGR